MPHNSARRSSARMSSSLLTFFGLLGLIALSAVSSNFMQPAAHAAATAFTVNSTGDGADSNTADGICNDGAGNCTLRAALEQANALPGTDMINFRIDAGVQTIMLGAVLPDVSEPVIIDGTTQPGYAGSPLIEIRKKDDFTGIPWGLHVTAGGSTVRALAFGRFDSAGILLGTEGANDAGANKVESCYGGLRADGVTLAAVSPGGICVKIADSPDNIIGGTSAAARNVLSGCSEGVNVSGAKSTGNVIQGNYIGTNAAGTAAVSNRNGGQSYGVNMGSASNNVIGGDTAAARNVISGNGTGVILGGRANAVKGNYIGTNAAGTAAIPNMTTGVLVFGSNAVVGGLAPSPGLAPGNLISGQGSNLDITGSGVTIQGNLIGMDVTGSSGFSSSSFGIVCRCPNALIGGTEPGTRNVISGLGAGIYIAGSGTPVIQGNYIGTDLTGTAARGNDLGIDVGGPGSQIGGAVPGAGNVISGNRGGVLLRNGASTVQGNLIGTDASGASPLPNLKTGIIIGTGGISTGDSPRNSVIGGTTAGAGNRIAFNGRSGITVTAQTIIGFFSTGNRIRGNSIFSNGLLGIDLVSPSEIVSFDADGPSLNDDGDSDTGPNGMQNAPAVTAVEVAGGTTSVRGRLDSAPNQTYAIDIYANASCDPSGYGEGQTYVGSTQATTDASGVATFSSSLPTPSSPAQVFTATATDAAGSTSEFSPCYDVSAAGTVQFTSPSFRTDEPEKVSVIVSRMLGTAGAATVDYATSDITAEAGADYVPASGTLRFAPGETTKTIDVTIVDDKLDENEESFRLTLSNPTGGVFLGTNATTEVHIFDNDPAPDVSVADSTVTEGNSGTTAAAFKVTLSEPSARTVTVSYFTSDATATAGSDYTPTSGNLTFSPGETSKTVNVPVIGDTTPEPNETFNLNLTSETNSLIIDPLGVCTILDDDNAAATSLRFSQASFPAAESAHFVTVTVTRAGDTSSAAGVDFATSDGTATQRRDYTAVSGRLEFAAGETSKTVDVLLTEDAYTEAEETINLTLSNPAGASLGDQPTATVNISADDDPPPGINPIDVSSDFVRQHYHDFLGRESDAPGLAFWTQQIESCQTTQCRDVKRINVSAAFFLSIEFQNTGYLVERMYKAAYGDATGTATSPTTRQVPVPIVRRSEFLADSRMISDGVIVGQDRWEQILESNKNAFALAFVRRQRFSDVLSPSMTAEQFVDKLFSNAGVTPMAAEREAAVSAFGPGDAAGRAAALRKVAESATFDAAEKNRAFVLMQFFGYLQRDPNAAPDFDHTGYQFWLDKLNAFNGNFVRAEMVKAFISSAEYRNRFGQ